MVISGETRAKIEAEIAKYPRRRGGLLPALHLVQKETGWISLETAREVAEIFGIEPVDVMEVVSFYNMFYDRPQGRHHVNVCTNLPCSLRGSRDLLRGLEAHLGVEAGKTTPDGRITLGHEECLGACGYAPMMRVDDRYHEDLDLDAAKKIVDGLE
ncbi:MAG: NAD(P)H-dependent oxidoreductase subunit E [Deltaproteobacteria bacterium]|nr:NAD(P)H-dependent oxidoreductase subunit E [Deltaproteobacteria bacterium]